jgi:hypothetical protein
MQQTHVRDAIRDVDALEDLLSEPREATVAAMAELEGDIVVLGVGGKMGPTLARMARRASDIAGISRRVIGIARFSSPGLRERLESWGVETLACDLLDPNRYALLPDARNVVYMAGMKFGSTGQEPLTWAMNSYLPAPVCQRYSGSRMAIFSTGNVYGFTPVSKGGSQENDPLHPVGEYAQSCLGRERIFEYFSQIDKIEMAILRLYYATELRYGVLVDVARRVWSEEPVPLTIGHCNAIWQTDASAMALESLAHASAPPLVLNLGGPELLSVRRVAQWFGERFQKPVHFEGVESGEALLCNAQKATEIFGYPRVSAGEMMAWIAEWVEQGKANLDKPTHFENRNGKF